ncbi:protein BatD [Vibrio sp. 05-20-BW147]|uniref:BatD family protein n=1 Tax=Vibrio sp. 05-20-BW147 TaxID=2575834 RepID=UPI001594C602|nr:BatD family protein [Vibrio sp. 05-20-BW147]NVC64724.1 protein BatD [Vibrio sp. 05-20-BW147]
MNRIVTFFILSMALLFPQVACAKSIVTSVNKTKVSKNEVVQLIVRADFSLDADDIDFSSLNQDFFTSGPRFLSSSNYTNGKSSKLSEWTLSIAPNRAGYLTIPSFSAEGVSSDPIVLEVSVDQHEPKQQEIVQYALQLAQETLYPQQSTQLKVEIRILADPRRLENPRIAPPAISGMQLEPLGQSRQYQRVENGLQITVIEQNYRLTAETEGRFELFGPRLTGSYIYGDSLTGSTKILTLDAPASSQVLTVKPIPTDAVKPWLPAAELTLKQAWLGSSPSTDKVEQGSSVTREITLTAKGIDQNLLPPLTINYPDSVRVYSEKPVVTQHANGAVEMKVKQVLIPTTTGELTLPSLQLDWWNTQTDQADKAFLEGRQLNITPSTAQVYTLPVGSDEPAASTDAQHSEIHSAPNHTNIWFYLTWVFAAFWLLSSILAGYWYKRAKTVPRLEGKGEEISHVSPSLEQCLTSGDAIQIEARVRAWIKQHAPNTEVLNQIEQELHLLHQATYANGSREWPSDKLSTLLKTHGKSPNFNDDFSLPKL